MSNIGNEKSGKIVGLTATILIHALLFLICFYVVFDSNITAPKEAEILIDFTQPKATKVTPIKTEPKLVKAPDIDKRALFASPSSNEAINKNQAKIDDRISNSLQGEETSGNSALGQDDGEPSASLEGRSVMGTLPFPIYNVNKQGKVVVLIRVDQYGKVISARAGYKGTTVQDKTLWDAAVRAALEAKFNVSSNSPAIQEGTITYKFKLK